jgi:hypothetical protein
LRDHFSSKNGHLRDSPSWMPTRKRTEA